MPITKCERTNCEYHGIDVCMINRNNVNKDCICASYKPREPVRINPTDLRAPFNSNCHKEHGKYKSDKAKTLK